MGGRLVTDVYVDGVLYPAGSEAPDSVTNPAAFSRDAWADDSLKTTGFVLAADPAAEAVSGEQTAGSGDDSTGGDAPEAPPRGGPGSGADAWAEYAEALGVEFPDGATRDEIIAAVDAAAG